MRELNLKFKMESPWYLWIGEFMTYYSYFVSFNLMMYAFWQYFTNGNVSPLLLGFLSALTLFFGFMARPIPKPDASLLNAVMEANKPNDNQDE